MTDAPWSPRRQFLAYALLAGGVVVSTIAVRPGSRDAFSRVLGDVDPLLVVGVAAVVGGAALGLLHVRAGVQIVRGRATIRGLGRSVGVATLFAVAIISADVLLRYPEGINVPFPRSLWFYPIVGFVAEIVFHVVPWALLRFASAPLRKRFGPDRLVWCCVLLVAALEPSFQMAFEASLLSWTAAYTWVHVYAFNVVQLWIFRRYDFASMFALRLTYYAYWHVAWGALRLGLLF